MWVYTVWLQEYLYGARRKLSKGIQKEEKTPFCLKVRGKHNFCISHASYMDCYLSE